MHFRILSITRIKHAKPMGQKYFSNSPSHGQFILAHTIYDPPTKDSTKLPFLITHGLLGSRNNFNSIAKAVAKATNRQVVTFDARNHGDSPHAEDSSYDAMSQDISVLVEHLNIPKFSLMGHSMGARTVMTYALKNPELLEKLIVVDMSPITKALDMAIMAGYIKELQSIKFDKSLRHISDARKFADKALKAVTNDAGLRAFLLTNLAQKDNQMYWKPNLSVLLNSLDKIGEFQETLLKNEFSSPTMFVKGELSPYIPNSDFPIIRKTFKNANLIVIKGSGHWPHADNATIFLEHVVAFLNEVQ